MRTSTYRLAAATLNSRRADIAPWIRDGAIIYLSDDKPREIPAGTPAWYLPHSGDIYICITQIMETMHGTIGVNALNTAFERLLAPDTHYDRVEKRFDKLSAAVDLTAATILGLIQHEAAHSKWSHWMQSSGDDFRGRGMKAVVEVIMQFEELRIEHQVVTYGARRGHLAYLLSSTERPLQLSFAWLSRESSDSFFESGTKRDIAGAWALIYGRHLAGVVERSIVEGVNTLAETKIGPEDLEKLEKILVEAIELKPEHGVHKKLIELAKRWLEIVGEAGEGEVSREILVVVEGAGSDGSDEEGEEDASGSAADAAGSGEEPDDEGESKADAGSDESGDGEDDADDVDDGDGAADDELGDSDEGEDDDGDIEDDYDIKEHHGYSEGASETVDEHVDREMRDLLERVVDGIAEEISKPIERNIRLTDSASEARKVLEKKQDYGHVYKESTRTPYQKRWQVEPSTQDRNEVLKVARQLERISMPAVTKQKLPHELPPGRVNMRAAMAAAVDHEAGRKTSARPWKRTKRTHSETRPTIVGIMTDISGSMGWAEKATARFGYIFSNAGMRVAARTAVVAFGDGAEVMVRPGERLDKLRYRDADGGSEFFDEGAAALDGMLHLTELRNTVRLVMVTSDGHFVREREQDRALLWVERWRQAGVHIVWCGFEEEYRSDFAQKLRARGVIIDPSRDLVEAGMRTLTKFV